MQSGILSYRLQELILYQHRDTLMPELFDLLGEDLAVKFIQHFGGLKLEVPSFQKVLDLQRDLDVYHTLSSSNNEKSIRILAEKYGVTEVWIRELFKGMVFKYPKIREFVERVRNKEPVWLTTKRNPRRHLDEIERDSE